MPSFDVLSIYIME